jgi:hypothetical protein
VFVGVSFLDGLRIMDCISGGFLQANQRLKAVFKARVFSVCMSIGSRTMMAVVEIERGFAGA